MQIQQTVMPQSPMVRTARRAVRWCFRRIGHLGEATLRFLNSLVFPRGFRKNCGKFFPMPETSISSVRLDKWLWAVRLFKTRSVAADACRHGRVTINGQPGKPSREVRINDIVVVLTDELTRRFKVLQPLHTRVGAQKVREFAEDQTPPPALQTPRDSNPGPFAARPKGSGRPTKKERRQIERLGHAGLDCCSFSDS